MQLVALGLGAALAECQNAHNLRPRFTDLRFHVSYMSLFNNAARVKFRDLSTVPPRVTIPRDATTTASPNHDSR